MATQAVAQSRPRRGAATQAVATGLALIGNMHITGTGNSALIPAGTFQALAFWDKLEPTDQATVEAEGNLLAQAMYVNGASRLAMGEHLAKLQPILEPRNFFLRFLRNFRLSKRTAYRYINGFHNASAKLPVSILQGAMARGMNMLGETDAKPLGIYTEAAAKLPPPANPTVDQANTWLDQVEKVRKETRQANADAIGTGMYLPEPTDPATALKECFRFVANRYKALPNNARSKATWVKQLVGMLLTEMGATTAQQITPVAIPEAFTVGRGRPRENQVAVA